MTSRDCHHCNEFTRATLLRRGAAEAGSGLPAIEPGMPSPAGTGLNRGAFLSRTLGAMLTVYGAGALGPRAFDEAIARAASGGSAATTLVSVFAPGGWDALSLLYPSGDPNYRRLRPELALQARRRAPSSRATTGCTGTPRSRRSPSCTARGSSPSSRRSATPTPTSRTSPRATTGRWARSTPSSATGWLGRVLDVIGDDTNPLQGLSLDPTLLPSLATAKVPVATLENPTSYTFDSQNVWDVPGALLPDAIGSLGGLSDPDRPVPDPGEHRRRRSPTSCAASSARFIGAERPGRRSTRR